MAYANQKELILINPRTAFFFINLVQIAATRNPVPHSLLTLSALTPQEYKTKIINQKQFWLGRDFSGGKLVGITCLTSAVSEAYWLADKFRKAGSRVILGGPHASALPEEALGHADSIVIGEAESVWGYIVKDFENDRLQKVYKGEPLEDFFTPVYDFLLHLDPRILSRAGVHIDRGCKYHCDFCARISNWMRFIKIEQVLEIIKRIKAAKRNFFIRRPSVLFRSDNIYSSPHYAKRLFKELIPLKINWGANCSIDIGFDAEALRLAKASGCKGFLIGFETIHPHDYRKTSLSQISSAEDYKIAIKNIKAHGIRINGFFIVGLDQYSHLDYLKLLWFLIRSGLWQSGLTFLTPFPGSQLFDRLQRENRILSFDWRKYNLLICVIKPKRMSVLSIYMWFWFIRIASLVFSPIYLLCWISWFLGWQVGFHITH